MKKTLKFGLGLLVLSVTFVFCSKDDDNNNSSTSTTSSTTSSTATTSTTSTGSSNYFISGGTTINLTSTLCANTNDTIFSEIIPISTVSGIAADGSTISASFYRGETNPVAPSGNYFSVNDESNLASGKCYISGLDKTRDEFLLVKPNLQITLKNDNGKLTVEFSDKTFDAVSATFSGTRQVSAKFGCN